MFLLGPRFFQERRAEFTLGSLRVLDVTVDRYVDRGGVRFATRFSEWVRQPLQIAAHKWHAVALDVVPFKP